MRLDLDAKSPRGYTSGAYHFPAFGTALNVDVDDIDGRLHDDHDVQRRVGDVRIRSKVACPPACAGAGAGAGPGKQEINRSEALTPSLVSEHRAMLIRALRQRDTASAKRKKETSDGKADDAGDAKAGRSLTGSDEAFLPKTRCFRLASATFAG